VIAYTSWHVGMKVVCVQGVRPKAYGSISARGEDNLHRNLQPHPPQPEH